MGGGARAAAHGAVNRVDGSAHGAYRRGLERSDGAPDDRVVIRAGTPADVERIASIERTSFSDPWSRRSFADLMGDRRVFFGVAQSASVPVLGYVIAIFVADEGEIANLAVDPSCRGQGVGAALLDAALREARVRGAVAVYLEVRDSNAAARGLYASRGFVEVGRRRNYYRKPVEDALVLRLEIPRPKLDKAHEHMRPN